MFENHPYLIEVTSNVFDIPARVKEYDSSLFVVRNTQRNTFEIHSRENIGSTYCMTVPFSELDARIIEYLKKHDLRNRGNQIFKEMHEHNQKLEDAQEKERKNWIQDVVKETRWHFKKTYEES